MVMMMMVRMDGYDDDGDGHDDDDDDDGDGDDDDDGEQWTECFLFQGWCGSADPRKRGTGTKNAEVENLHLR